VAGARILVYGYGNPGRQDDGLGPAMVDRLEAEPIPGVATDSNYQLQVEDAMAVSESDTVIFVDASVSGDAPFVWSSLEPERGAAFTTHAVSPGSVLALCRDLYGRSARAYVLAIRGFGWEFTEGLTPMAERNLEAAYRFMRERIDELLTQESRVMVN
jgi:hydrogenase maturation protease